MTKLAKFILPTLLIAVFLIVPTISSVKASPDIVFSDAQDGDVRDDGLVTANAISFSVGDQVDDYYRRGFVKFSLAGLSSTVASATLNIAVVSSVTNDVPDNTDPLNNIGLGDLQVLHINDYGTLDASDFAAASIGNDPGVLIGSSATPNVGYVSVDVTAAMQDDINNGRSFTSYLLKMATDTDNDDLMDMWELDASEAGVLSAPYIEYTLSARAVGGILTPVNKLTILAPYLALLGLVGAVTVAVAVQRRLKT